MSNVVEDRIINLKFNNKDFEKNAAQSMRTIDALEEKLTFKNVASKGVDAFKGIINAAKQVPPVLEQIADAGSLGMVSKLKAAFTKNGDMFSPLMEMATGAFRQIGQEAYQLGKQITTSLTTQQVDAGWQKYADKTASVQTIMNATGKSIDVVTEALAKLNWYSDETSYSYTDMTSNIAKFTSSGVDLNTAVTAMIGIGNAAGLAGAKVQDASHAMAGFAKAIGQGYMDRMKWSWIETAQMDTQQFKKSLIEAAVALGTLRSNGDGTYSSAAGRNLTSLDNFEADLASGKWMTAEVMLRALQDYGALTNEIYSIYEATGGEKTTSEIIEEMGVAAEDLGLKAFKASQEAKTFADAIDSVKDAVSTGWMTTFDTIFGNYEEAKKLWTDFANWLYDMFAESGNYRNEQLAIFMGREAIDEELGEYYKIGDDLVSGREYFLQAIYKFMDVISAYAEAIKMAWDRTFGAWDYETIGEIAKRIHRVAELLGSTLEKDLSMDPKKVDKWTWLDNQNRNSFIVKFRLAMERFFGILKETVITIQTMGKTFYEALYDAFGDKNDRTHGLYISGFYKWFNDITLRIAKFIKTFRQVLTDNNRFKRILNGNFAILKIFFNVISDAVDYIIQNGGGIVAIIAEILASLGDFAVSLNQSNLYDFIRGLFPLVNTLSTKILNAVLSILGVVGKVKDFFLGFFTGLDNRLGESGSFQKLINGFKHLGDALSKLLGLDKLGEFFDTIGAGPNGMTFLDSVIDTADKAIAALGGFFDLVASGIFKVMDFGDTLAGIASSIGTSIGAIFGSLFGSSSDAVRGGMPGMVEEKQSIFDILRIKASSMLTNLFSDVDNAEVTRGATNYTGSVISGVIEGLQSAIKKLDEKGIDWNKVKFLGYFVGFIVTLININKDLVAANDLVKNFTSIPEAISNAITNFGGMFGSIKDFFKEATESLSDFVEVQKLEVIAKVISTLSLIVMMLSSIPEEALAKGVTYLGIITAIFVAFNKAMGAASALLNVQYMKDSVNITKSIFSGNTLSWNAGPLGWAAVIISLASFVSSIVTAINTMTTVDGNDVVKAAGVILGIIGVMGVMLYALGQLGAYFVQTGHNKTLSDQILANGTTSHKETSNDLSGPSGKFFYGIAAAMLALSIGIKIVVDAITVLIDAFENNQTSSVVSALLVVFGLYGAIVLTTVGMMTMVERWAKNAAISDTKVKQLGKTMILIGATIAIISVSMGIIATAVATLAVVFALINNPSAAFMAMGTVAAILALTFGFIVLLMSNMKQLSAGQINQLGKNILLIGTAIAIISGSVAIIIGSIVGMIAVLMLESGVLKIMGREEIILMSIGVVGAIMAAMMIFMIALITQFTNISDSKITKIGRTIFKIAEAMVVMSAAMLVIAASVALVAKSGVKTEQGIALALGMFTAFAALLATVFVTNKLGVRPGDVKVIAESLIIVAGAMVAMGLALAVVSAIDVNGIWQYFGVMAASVGLLAAITVILAFVASKIPAAQPVIVAFAVMMASMAAMMIGFAVGVAVVTKSIVPLTNALGPFGTALSTFLSSIKDNVWTLIPLAIAFSFFAATIAAVVIGAVALIIAFRSQIGNALTGMFSGIQHLFQQFGTWFSGLPKKTQTMIKVFALAIASGLVAATPEMYAQIEAGFMILMERLGDSVGWITEGLVALVINIVNGLADAIRANAGPLAYAIASAVEAVGEVLMNLIAGIIQPILGYIYGANQGFLRVMDHFATGVLVKFGFATPEAEKEYYEDQAKGSIALFKDAYDEAFEDQKGMYFSGLGDMHELGREWLDTYAKTLGVDTSKPLSQLSKENSEKAKKEIDKSTSDLQKYAHDKVSGVGSGLVSGLETARTQLSGYLNGKGLNLESLLNQVKSGISVDDLMSDFMGEGGFDNEAWANMQTVLNGEGINAVDYEAAAANIMNADQSVADLTQNTAVGGTTITNFGDKMDDTSDKVTQYNDALNKATEAQNEFDASAENLEADVNAKKPAFFDAGIELLNSVEDGFNQNWADISGRITGKFRQLADDIRSMLEMGDLTVGISNVVPVYNADEGVPPSNNQAYNYLWDRDAGKNAMSGEGIYSADKSKDYFVGSRPSGSYYEAMESYGQYLANNISFAKQRAAAQEDFSKMREDMKELKNAFTTFTGKAETFYNKDTNIYLDGDKLVGGTADKIWDVVSIKANQEMRSGG